jgi:hypothetical protein
MGLWSSVSCDFFRYEMYGDVKTSGNNARGRIIWGQNVRGRLVNVPTSLLLSSREAFP